MIAGEAPTFESLLDKPLQRITSSVELSTPNFLPETIQEKQTRKKLNELSEEDVLSALEEKEWNIQSAAQALGISRPSMYKLIEINSKIRRVEKISTEEIQGAWQASNNDIEACASLLKTPAEALRRHLQAWGTKK